MKIKKGDNVIVIAGKDKGKTGKVLRAFPKLNKVIVENVNVVKKHVKARGEGKKGQTVDKTMPLDVSNVMFEDLKTKKPTRVSYKIEDNKKTRIAVKSGQKI